MITIVSAIMRQFTTTDEIYGEFMKKRADLTKKGWAPYGDVMYYTNAVSQAMTFGTPDMSDLPQIQCRGSKTPQELKFCFGGEGGGVYAKYYDINQRR